jgi:hypothetical protein
LGAGLLPPSPVAVSLGYFMSPVPDISGTGAVGAAGRCASGF